jgi:hypothetical protein
MATRKQLFHPDEVKKKIQTSQLINRLQNHALFVDDPEMEKYERVKMQTVMSDSQVRAAFGLLDKVVPNLKAVEHSGDPDAPIITIVERRIVKAGD